jgi:hypothetical protein
VPARRARRLNSRSAEKFFLCISFGSSTPTMGKQSQIINFSGGLWTAGFRAHLPETGSAAFHPDHEITEFRQMPVL